MILRVEKGMYGLTYVDIIVQELLDKRLELEGYTRSDKTPGFWYHKWRPISFTLIVDDFGVKYVGKEHANHLLAVVKDHFVVDVNCKVSEKYCGANMDCD